MVFEAARRISQALVMSMAIPKVRPNIAAMTGCVHFARDLMAA